MNDPDDGSALERLLASATAARKLGRDHFYASGVQEQIADAAVDELPSLLARLRAAEARGAELEERTRLTKVNQKNLLTFDSMANLITRQAERMAALEAVILRSLDACPLCRDGVCRADVHQWLSVALGDGLRRHVEQHEGPTPNQIALHADAIRRMGPGKEDA
jgi:hypothetical protein